ncbi:hypothetical protein IWQ60_005557 [Tieghemiomyces parasiticus]|uniref:PH domain-containing protein n=1 Tax=Tieghemiomyces parasiticus TaxID=78921 RepID=A0A9W8DYC9_9FUNG|nr:hypothetical protein IWQ60_005557 [Tieghemiomyces parasiticus]
MAARSRPSPPAFEAVVGSPQRSAITSPAADPASNTALPDVAAGDQTIWKKGFLYKRSSRLKVWKKKWFVLRTSSLSAYKNEKEYELISMINLNMVRLVSEVSKRSRHYVIGIITVTKIYYLQAENIAIMSDWIGALTEACDHLKNPTGLLSQMESVLGSAAVSPYATLPRLVRELPNHGTIPSSATVHGRGDSSGCRNGGDGPRSNRDVAGPSSRPMPRWDDHMESGTRPDPVPLPSPSNLRSPTVRFDLSNATTSADQRLSVRTSGLSIDSPAFHSDGYSPRPPLSASPGDLPSASVPIADMPDDDDEGDDDDVSSDEDLSITVYDPSFQESFNSAEILHRGYLLKRDKYKQWRKRWFVLRMRSLSYYRSEKQQDLPRVILLEKVQSIREPRSDSSKSKRPCLRLGTPKRSYWLCGDSQSCIDTWGDYLRMLTNRPILEE